MPLALSLPPVFHSTIVPVFSFHFILWTWTGYSTVPLKASKWYIYHFSPQSVCAWIDHVVGSFFYRYDVNHFELSTVDCCWQQVDVGTNINCWGFADVCVLFVRVLQSMIIDHGCLGENRHWIWTSYRWLHSAKKGTSPETEKFYHWGGRTYPGTPPHRSHPGWDAWGATVC